ncbi:hypothetical protein C100_14805 [Sphingobium sp. C100]|nr:hypothetical protein C100_14805 [Sphingobium sp. C100]
MAVERTGAIGGASQRDRSEAEDGGTPLFCFAMQSWQAAEKSGAPAIAA